MRSTFYLFCFILILLGFSSCKNERTDESRYFRLNMDVGVTSLDPAFARNQMNVWCVNQLFNGNISETFWRSDSDNILRKYEYTYDDLNRLLEANYSKPNDSYNTSPPITPTDSYLEKLTYDKNGNIQSLKRNGDLDSSDFAIEIDDLEQIIINLGIMFQGFIL